jgi:hypothetical protein
MMNSRTGQTLSCAATFSILSLSFGQAQPRSPEEAMVAPDVPPASESEEPPAPVQEESAGPFSFEFSLDYLTAYFWRGMVQEDSGLIIQPEATISLELVEDEDWSVSGFFSVWNTIHGQQTGAAGGRGVIDYWYEADLSAGVILARGPLSLTTSYTIMTSPNDAFESIPELAFTLEFDDSELLGKWALNPFATLAIENGANAGEGADSETGTYLELGIAPGFELQAGRIPVTIAFPITVGLSLEDYYQNEEGEDDTFGFLEVGINASIPLPFKSGTGEWQLNAGVSALFLGDHTAEFNDGDDTELVARIGVSVQF